MNYHVSVEKTFSAAHALRGYKGKCERMHGHTWKVKITLSGKRLNSLGMLVDFTELKEVLGGILEKLDHTVINEVPPFTKINPTAENIARHVYDLLRSKIHVQGVDVHSAEVWESETSSARVTA